MRWPWILLTLLNFGLQRAGEDYRDETIEFIRKLSKTSKDMRWVKLLPAHPIITCFGVDIVAKAFKDEDAEKWPEHTGHYIEGIARRLDAQLEPNKYQKTGEELVNRFEIMLATGNVDLNNKDQFEKIASEIGRENTAWFLGLNPEEQFDAFQQALAIKAEINRARALIPAPNLAYLSNTDIAREFVNASNKAFDLLTKSAIAAHRHYLESQGESGSEQAVGQRFEFPPLPENMPNCGQISDALMNENNERSNPSYDNPNFQGLEKTEAEAIVQFAEQSGISGWTVGPYRRSTSSKWTVKYIGKNFDQDVHALRQELGLLLEGKILL